MVETLEVVDSKLTRLSGLAHDCSRESYRWNLVMGEINRLLEERGRIILANEEIRDLDDDNDSV